MKTKSRDCCPASLSKVQYNDASLSKHLLSGTKSEKKAGKTDTYIDNLCLY